MGQDQSTANNDDSDPPTEEVVRRPTSGTRKRRRAPSVSVKRACNAFTYFVKDQARRMSEFSPENMKVLADKWKNMSEERKRPYEIQAQADARRYQMEMAQIKQSNQLKMKRPATGYILFVSDFMKNNAKKYRTVQEAISEGARRWKQMDDEQKAPWMFMGKMASEQYEQAKSRLKKLPKTGPAQGTSKTAAVQAKATTKAGAVSKAKVKSIPGKKTPVKVKAAPAKVKATPTAGRVNFVAAMVSEEEPPAKVRRTAADVTPAAKKKLPVPTARKTVGKPTAKKTGVTSSKTSKTANVSSKTRKTR